MGAVRRSLAGLLFGVAFAFASLAVSGLMLQRAAFSPDGTGGRAESILQDDEVRLEAVRVVSDATADQMYPGDPTSAALARQNVATVASLPAGAALFAEMLSDVHAVLIGDVGGPVVVPPAQLVQITRDERAAVLPPLRVEVPRIGALATTDAVLGWSIPFAGVVAVVFFVLCLLARPERGALFRSLGIGLVVLAALSIVFGYVIPLFLPPVLDESPWARVPSLVAADRVRRVVAGAFLLTAIGALLFAASTRMGRRKRWSTPVSTYRYREERNWS